MTSNHNTSNETNGATKSDKDHHMEESLPQNDDKEPTNANPIQPIEDVIRKRRREDNKTDSSEISGASETQPSVVDKPVDINDHTKRLKTTIDINDNNTATNKSEIQDDSFPELEIPKEGKQEMNSDLAESFHELRNVLTNLVDKLPKSRVSSFTWGSLIPTRKTSGNPIPIVGTSFTVGKYKSCHYQISDPRIDNFMFRLTYKYSVPQIERVGLLGKLLVNGVELKIGQKLMLRGNDEITLIGEKGHQYIFQSSVKIPDSPSFQEGPPSAASITPRRRQFSRRHHDDFTLTLEPLSPGPLRPGEIINSMNNNNQIGVPPEPAISFELAETLKKKYKQLLSPQLVTIKDNTTTFDAFPYYLNNTTKQQLISSAYIYLMKPEYVKYINELPISRRILLGGPTGSELYQETLARALASHFQANFMSIDSSLFEIEKEKPKEKDKLSSDESSDDSDWQYDSKYRSRRDKSKNCNHNLCRLARNSERIKLIGKSSISDDHPTIEVSKENDEISEINIIWETIIETLTEDKQPSILFIKDIEEVLLQQSEKQVPIKKILGKIEGSVILIGSSINSDRIASGFSSGIMLAGKGGGGGHTALLDIAFFDHLSRGGGGLERGKDTSSKVNKLIPKLFPNRITIHPPPESSELSEWTKKINKDIETLKSEKNKKSLRKIMEQNKIECASFDSPLLSKTVYTMEHLEKIVGWAVSHYLMNLPANVTTNEPLCIDLPSLEHALTILKNSESESKGKTLKDVEPENEFERKLVAEVIPPTEIDIKFEDIGALDDVKKTLKELVMLPLQRPELFSRGNLTKPTKGILLFGPPGTGKTMLAKAVATQCGANFINISMSTIASKWFGEGEKYVKAVFTLASKISPTVIFIDEVDSILGKRDRNGEHEAMRKIKNEFMLNWDGLKSKDNERVLVLAATNRPFDLDDAVLRRLSRRLMVDLPDAENRAKILKVILAKEDLSDDVDLKSVAQLTDGFSGSDLKNLCVAAAYQPIREFLETEKSATTAESEPKTNANLRPLSMKDFEKSLKEISASVSEDAISIGELRKWNEMYGEGGQRKPTILPYFM